ncbi:peptidase S8/S53, subtilisin/kexin/sedolisin [Diplogelasinospora grovesii]|uniref:Peptidase S8/S53, subtilisin/kexin/sedolisin n=1 Tax=Diplogelasinospora grovesii TaxID=303347 RepID=A0AAN6N008_9PEZI|nr:peptidase S8/S53, subtilisin/kexin/sedolisin [Diplogelasinospora grovesii]
MTQGRIALLSWCYEAQAKAVFAHFMVAHIDAFALNIAAGYSSNAAQVANAFKAVVSVGVNFQFFFSFDYAGNGSWAITDVESYLTGYINKAAYYRYNNQPFVSTFKGTSKAEDWVTIKANTGCFFVPDWSSAGAGPALTLAGGVADGLFSWAAWPWANAPITQFVDASYTTDLGSKPYMMPVSP